MLPLRSRTILKTIDGKTIVRPLAQKDEAISDGSNYGYLNEEGVQAWNSGEEIKWFHFWAYGNLRSLLNANF